MKRSFLKIAACAALAHVAVDAACLTHTTTNSGNNAYAAWSGNATGPDSGGFIKCESEGHTTGGNPPQVFFRYGSYKEGGGAANGPDCWGLNIFVNDSITAASTSVTVMQDQCRDCFQSEDNAYTRVNCSGGTGGEAKWYKP